MPEHPVLLAANPWFCDLCVPDVIGIERNFADGTGMLPAHLPIMDIPFYDWRACIAIPPSILRGSSTRGCTSLCLRIMEIILDRLELPPTDALTPTSSGTDTWKLRTESSAITLIFYSVGPGATTCSRWTASCITNGRPQTILCHGRARSSTLIFDK